MQWEPTDSPYVMSPLGTQVWVEANRASASLGAWTYTMAPRIHWSLNCGPFDGPGCSDYEARLIGPGPPPVETLPDGSPPPDSWALLVVPPAPRGRSTSRPPS